MVFAPTLFKSAAIVLVGLLLSQCQPASPTPTPFPTPTPMPTATPFPTPTPDPRIDIMSNQVDRLARDITRLSTPVPTPTFMPIATPTPSIAQIYNWARPSVARIEAGKKVATGWAISHDLIITTYFVGEVSVYLPTDSGEAMHRATAIGADKLRDIALLKVPTTLKPLRTRPITRNEVPERVLAIGWANGWAYGDPGYPGAKLGSVSLVRSVAVGSLFLTDIAIEETCFCRFSIGGTPVLDMEGQVVGMIQTTLSVNSLGQLELGGLTIASIDDSVLSELMAGKAKNSDSIPWYQKPDCCQP